MEYPRPGLPKSGEDRTRPSILPDENWRLYHGAWSVLRHLYSKAEVPASQLSLDERCGFKEHSNSGREIKNLRDRGVLILGSGNRVRKLGQIDWESPHGAYDWAREFDSKVKTAVDGHDGRSLADRRREIAGYPRIRQSSTIFRCCIAWGVRMSGMR